MLKASDFESFNCCVLLGNTVTQTAVTDSKKIQIGELQKRGMVLRLPHTACATGHIVTLYVFQGEESLKMPQSILLGNQPIPGAMGITAKATSLEPSTDKTVVITFEFLQFNEQEWNKLIGAIEARQTEVDDLIQKIRD